MRERIETGPIVDVRTHEVHTVKGKPREPGGYLPVGIGRLIRASTVVRKDAKTMRGADYQLTRAFCSESAAASPSGPWLGCAATIAYTHETQDDQEPAAHFRAPQALETQTVRNVHGPRIHIDSPQRKLLYERTGTEAHTSGAVRVPHQMSKRHL